MADIFRGYGLSDEEVAPIVRSFSQRPQDWIDFMMRFELGLEKPAPGRALRSALTIGGAYAVGGLILLGPFAPQTASIGSAAAAAAFGTASLVGG